MSSHVPSPVSSPASGAAHDSQPASQDTSFRSSQNSDPDTSCLSLESSFQLESGYPAQADTEKHPKGKRKRTTTQDKAILEAAYNANPKPDKAVRLDLVKRVSLNEKEVQIWFQNRRQNDRRKSRPLSPQEIAAFRYGGGLHVLSSDPASFGAGNGGDAVEPTRPAEGNQRSPSPANAASSQEWSQSPPRAASSAPELLKQERRASAPTATIMTPTPPPSSMNGTVAGELQSLSQSLPSSVGYLSNRWNTSTSFSAPSSIERPVDTSMRVDSFPGAAQSATNTPPSPILPLPTTNSSSKFRLSLSLEGKAELVSSLQSPPRPAPQPQLPLEAATLPPVRAPRTLQRSRSALPGITLPPISSLTANLPPQLTRGRSRDVSAWESCCEAETRDELTKLAESESSGSAIAAISLLRSSSSTGSLSSLVHAHASGNSSNVLRPNSSKRNAPASRRDPSKKSKLARTTSSVARLQSLPSSQRERDIDEDEFEPEKKKLKHGLSVVLSPSGDSDKENWSPDEDGGSTARRRPLPSIAAPAPSSLPKAHGAGTNPRRIGSRVLGESNGLNGGKRQGLGSRANTAPVPRLKGGKYAADTSVSIFEDGDEQDDAGVSAKRRKRSDDEVERFMRGEVSPSKKGDVDCVAGLLALSQGNWR
ncbi:uncharacterized protein JN550_013319 [Neoarthrinium moseri]|uniref:uncharacterized protein n=1 Tax=Neoarthrinium moseri TaxID=1658444 RepID=UPI001FDD9751|nr:uncharacterized protein JN550_013319 [Neoarthrinium moseri]KAI1857293.1 hypothetical protein JN550_013319 [Neoarthrinium moseri]